MGAKTRKAAYAVGSAAIVAFFLIGVAMPLLSAFLTELWWFTDLGQSAVFLKRMSTAVCTGLAAGIVAFAFMGANAVLVARNIWSGSKDASLRQNLRRMALAVSSMSGLIAGFAMGSGWMKVLQFFSSESFGWKDPVFGLDASFYVFRLPLLEVLYRGAMQLILTAAAISAASYLIASLKAEKPRYESQETFGARRRGPIRVYFTQLEAGRKKHLALLALAAVMLRACGYLLEMYKLVYSPRGVAFGASYADLYGTLPGLKVMIGLCVAAAVAVACSFLKGKSFKPAIAAAAILVVGAFLTGTAYPALVQQWYVEPNELAAEERFIKYNIQATRYGFDLGKIQEKDFVSDGDITAEDLAANAGTVENIRLWDWQPLLSTLSQLQEMRLYYSFNDVDIDRYEVDGPVRQVMLTARELDVDSLPQEAQTWINRHLKYTHGYGLVISPVNESTAEGLPTYLLKDIPPQGSSEFAIGRPEIYFGELTGDYSIVDTKADEFDYPMGEQNAETRWQGQGGVSVGGFFRKLAFAYRLGTVKLLLSADLTPESRVLYRRQISERLSSLAPFLRFDQDPYLVICEGRLKWVADAYTYTRDFPFSEPLQERGEWSRGPNYMRNSVKAVVDAYEGTVDFYIIDLSDPMIAMYSRIFPGLFKDADLMPDEIRAHFRYPEDLFMVQARKYAVYHMEDPAVFYNKEDLWSIPFEVFGSGTAEVSPYYVNMALPDDREGGQRFLIMIPFTPSKKNNIVSWMAGLCDDEDYGKAVIYKFSKQRIFYGPMQIESQIDQDSEVSKLFALWNQKGSSVIRGNLLVYPMDHSVLYIEPVFLAAERSQLPQLKLVLCSDGTRIAQGSTLAGSLRNLVGEPDVSIPQAMLHGKEAAWLAKEAERLLELAAERMRSGDWAGYGEAQEELGKLIRALAEKLGDGK